MIIDVVTLKDLDRPKLRPYSVTYWLKGGEREELVHAVDRHEAERVIQSRYNVDVAAYGSELTTRQVSQWLAEELATQTKLATDRDIRQKN